MNRSYVFKLNDVDIDATIAQLKQQLDAEGDGVVSDTALSTIRMLLLIVSLLMDRLRLNSRNNRRPPSSRSHRERIEKSPVTRKPEDSITRTGWKTTTVSALRGAVSRARNANRCKMASIGDWDGSWRV